MQISADDYTGQTGLVMVVQEGQDELASSALVLEAVGISFQYDQHGQQLLVAACDASTALFHLEEYRRENLHWPPLPPQPYQAVSSQTLPTLLVLFALALFFAQTGPWTPDNDWFTRGALNNTAVFGHGEWWRPLTALTLHADLAHLAGNCFIGGMVICALNKMIGFGQCWLLLVGTSALGNLINIGVRQEIHLSVGFSTAVFAAVGLLTGLRLASSSSRSIKAILLPLGASAGLLALLGSGGEHTDLGAHFFGLLCGLLGGWLGSFCGLIACLSAPAGQIFLFLLALSAPIAAWIWALA